MKYIALLVLLVACKEPAKNPPASSSAPAPSTAQPSRADACTSALVSFGKFVDTNDPNAPADQQTKLKASVHARCVADNWSDEALACMRSTATSHDVFACWNDKLTKDQRDAVGKALGDLKM